MQGALKQTDLNLFAVFEALDRKRSVTRAARHLGLSQPAVSHALNRLRHLLKDQLFVRSGHSMEPTPRAMAMAGPVREALMHLQSTVDVERFDPNSSRETFLIAVNNFAAIVFVAPLVTAVARDGPFVRLAIKPSGTLDLDLLLARGAIDLSIGQIGGLEGSDAHHLLDDRYVAVMRVDHEMAKSRLSAKSLAAASHLRISSIGDDAGFMDRELTKSGLMRTIGHEAPYIAAGQILEASDMVVVVASRIARELCAMHRLVWRELPFKGPTIGIGMNWPQIYERRASHAWLRAILKELVRSELDRHARSMVCDVGC